MVLATICYLALPSLGLHAFVPLVAPRPVVRWPLAPPEPVVEQATQRPAASGAYVQPLRPLPALPQGFRAPDVTLRLDSVSQAAPSLFAPASSAYRSTLLGTCAVALAAILLRRVLARRSYAARLRAWASFVQEKAKSLVYTAFAIAATLVMLLGSPVGALSTSEAPRPTSVQLQLPANRKLPRPLSNFIRRPQQAPQQKMIKYSAKNYIFSDDLTSMSRLEREFDDLLWHSLANRRLHRARTIANLGEGVLLVGALRGGLVAYERWQKEEERKDIEEELERTGMYVSVDASSVVEFTDAKTGEKKMADGTKGPAVIPGSIVIHYELPSADAKLAKAVREKVEASEFAPTMLEELQYKFQDLGELGEERAQLQGLQSLVFPKIPAVQAPAMEAGVIAGRVFLSDLGSDATESVVQGFGNSGTRNMTQAAFRGPLAVALGVEEEQVTITNIVRNRDPLFGDGSKLASGPVRQFLNNRAPSFLRWVESTSAAEDNDFWEAAVTQTIYRDTGAKNSKTDGKTGDDKPPSSDGPGDSPGDSPGDDPDGEVAV